MRRNMCNLKYTVCRTCLEAITQLNSFNIFMTEGLAKKLISCIGQPVETTDEYSNQLCQKCYENILKFYEFQQMCYKSLKTFLNLLKIDDESEQAENICEHYASDDLKQVLEKQNQVGESGIHEDSSSQIFHKTLEKKTRCRKTKTKLEDKELKRIAVRKKPLIRRNYKSGSAKDETKNDLKEYLQFSKEDKVNENIENGLDTQEPLAEQDEDIFPLEDAQVGDGINKEEEIERQQIEEIILTAAPESGCGSKPTFAEKHGHQCYRCNLKFKTAFKLQIHLRQHEGLAPYLCSFKGCACSFERWYSYKKHLKDHNEREGSFKCDMDNCERVYKNKSNLNIHKRKFHNFGPELKTHMCEICGKVFKSSTVLNDHQFTHIDKTQLPYACEEKECAKRFSTKEKLRIHKMRHAGIKNFVCPHCGMRKTTRNELKIHINYHTLERTWPCRFCPKVCNSAGNLKMHTKNIHEGAKDFACRFCQRTFAKADTKKYHEMTHTGEKPNECKECGRRFVQPAALRTHGKIHLKQKEKLANKSKYIAVTEKSCVAENTDDINVLTESIVAEILNDTTES